MYIGIYYVNATHMDVCFVDNTFISPLKLLLIEILYGKYVLMAFNADGCMYVQDCLDFLRYQTAIGDFEQLTYERGLHIPLRVPLHEQKQLLILSCTYCFIDKKLPEQ